MKFSVPAIVLSLCAALAASSPVPEPTGSDIDLSKVYIEGVTYAGSGCPAGSTAISNSKDWTVITLAFDRYIASIGPGIAFTERRKNCNINVKLHYPRGYQYTLYQTDITGRADLEVHVKAIQESTYWFAGENTRVTMSTPWTGVFSGNYNIRNTLTREACVWSPCGASTTLNINTQVFLDNTMNTKGSGFITTDVVDHKVKTLYGIEWRRC